MEEGNFGVGAVLSDANGDIVGQARNQVFKPRFRSDGHAEMMLISQYELEHRTASELGKLTLVTSLEPCPMCLGRLITAGVGQVYYVAIDAGGGMVHRMEDMPPAFQRIAAKMIIRQAECSPTLRDLALKAFLSTAARLDELLARS